jgi:hypothetical protein
VEVKCGWGKFRKKYKAEYEGEMHLHIGAHDGKHSVFASAMVKMRRNSWFGDGMFL